MLNKMLEMEMETMQIANLNNKNPYKVLVPTSYSLLNCFGELKHDYIISLHPKLKGTG